MKAFKLITFLACLTVFGNIGATITFSNELSKFILLNENSEIRIKNTGIYDNLDLGITNNLNNIDLVNSTSDLIIMSNDFQLDAGFLSTESFTIQGNGYSMIMNGDLTIPELTTLKVTSSLLIEGNGHTLFIDKFAQLLTDTHATLTFRNLILKNALNTPVRPAIAANGSNSQIAFDNVNIIFGDDFWFNRGNMFFHNDVLYSGGSKLLYTSAQPSFVAPNSTLLFDKSTTLFYCPNSTSKTLIIPQDPSSKIYLDGSTLQSTPTGLSLKEGSMFFENQVNFDVGTEFNEGAFKLYANSCGIDLRSMEWNYSGEFLAISGQAVSGTDQIKLYQLDSTITLSQTDSLSFGPLSSNAHCLAWSSDGIYLAVGGSGAGTGGGFTDSNNLRIYYFDNLTLTLQPVTSIDFGSTSTISSVDWGGIDGYFLAVGGTGAQPVGGFSNNDNLRIYHLDKKLGSLLPAASYNFGSDVKAAKWSVGGLYVAVGGYQTLGSCNLELLYFDAVTNTLTQVDTKPFGVTNDTYINTIAWSREGQFLGVGGGSFSNYTTSSQNIMVYKFNPANTPLLSFLTFANPVEISSTDYLEIKNLKWNPDTSLLLYSGLNPGTGNWSSDIYSFDSQADIKLSEFKQLSSSSTTPQYCAAWNPGTNLFTTGFYNDINVNSLIDISPKLIDSEIYTTNYSTTSGIYTIDWRPDGNYLVVGGGGASAVGGFSNTDEIRVYRFGTLSEALDPITTQAYGERVCSATWSPDGEHLAVGGINPVYGAGGFNNTERLRIYSFANNALSPVISIPSGSSSEIYSVSWHPSGKYVAIGCYNTGNDGGFLAQVNLRIYSFEGGVLVPVVGYDFGSNTRTPAAIQWSADGKYLAVGTCDGRPTANPTAGTGLYVFEFQDYSSLVQKATWSTSSAVLNLSWVFDNRFIAVNYNTNYAPLSFGILYFNGSSIQEIQNWETYNTSSVDFFNTDVRFSPDGEKIAYASKNGVTNNFGYLEIDDIALKNAPYHYQKVNGAFNVWSIAWRPDSKYIALSSFNSEQNAPQMAIIKVNNLININRENLNGLDFGKLIELNVLGNALINVNGFVSYGVEY